ncbi:MULTISPECIES: ABC transporter permease [Sphingomonas]|uniref:ABC transporter permease n=1 Tax=Sphingomonas TaxID=13687 RepID=UPI000DEFD15E|nr:MULTISPECIES: ABC transporter permease [Sphingomonas]
MTLPRMLQSALVIGRRDFTATVLSRTFIFFLIGPLFPLLIGGVFGTVGASVAGDTSPLKVAVVATQPDYDRLAKAAAAVQPLLGDKGLELIRHAPEADLARQQDALLDSKEEPAAVLVDAFGHPRLTGSIDRDGKVAREMRLILAQASATAGPTIDVQSVESDAAAAPTPRDLTKTARTSQGILFFFTLLLAGMLLSQLIEEKSNKVIEVLAAAVPIESIFLGKLFAMLLTSLVGIAVWSSAGALALRSLAPDAFASLPVPAVGWPMFGLLALAYFSMNYLLIGGVFLGIGALASTARQVQILSMPVTMAQVVLFAIASAAVGKLDGPYGIFATLFPLSSPYLMLARAATTPVLWVHPAGLVWQALWVAIVLRVAAGVFRRSVLKSGRQGSWFRRARAA